MKDQSKAVIQIREVTEEEREEALALAWNVFGEYEAKDYSKEGIETFHECITNPDFTEKLRVYGAFNNERIIGVLATRKEGSHIALFFVNGEYHRQGIGKKLFKCACKDNRNGFITVNSAPYATEIYHHLGFKDIDTEQLQDGIRYTPMRCELR